MTDNEKKIPYPYRVTVTISPEQRIKLNNLLRWGIRQRLLEKVIEMLTDLLEKVDNPELMAAFILDDQLIFEIKEEANGNAKGYKTKHPIPPTG